MSTVSISQEEIRPPEPPGPITWARQNLFSGWLNSLITIVLLGVIAWSGYAIVRWIFFTADWRPILNPLLYLVGQYPREEIWRLGVIVMIMSFLFGASWRLWGGMIGTFALTYALSIAAVVVWPSLSGSFDASMRIALIANLAIMLIAYLIGGMQFMRGIYLTIGWILSLIVSIFLMNGIKGVEWLPVVATGNWGGLLVTLLLAVGGIVISFPIGVLLALGRRSSLPVVSIFSTIFIEVVRGVPLIGILFLSSLILPLFLPPDVRIDRLLRALIGMTLFSAAYMAENVRGGLAAVPQGQVEAANALGLNNFQITALIVLPQALRAVIPPIVGQFISLFKDTTLASGVAVLELLSVGRSILQANPEYIGLQMEVYLFIAAIFWILSYMMSYASLRLEVALGVGER